MAASKQEVAEKAENLPAELAADLYNETATGFEDTTVDDYAIPYLSIAQSNSPQLKKTNAKYIEGIEMGNLFDTVTGKVFEWVDIIPVYRDRAHVEWVPRDEGGGFVARHEPSEGILDQTEKNEKGRDMLPNGNEIIDTVYLYVLVVDHEDDNLLPMVISFARTSQKTYRKLMFRAQNLKIDGPKGKFNPPLWSHIYRMETVLEVAKSGDEYYNWKIGGGPVVVNAEQLAAAKALREAVVSGEKGAATPEDDSEGPAARASDEGVAADGSTF